MMCRRPSAPMTANLYPLTEFDNESSVLPSDQTNNSSRMKAFKRRSCALNYLYKNVMDKKNSADIVSVEHSEKDSAPNLRARTAKSSRDSSRMNSSSTLSLTLAGDSRAPKTRNPISFYENDLNLTRSSSASSTVDLPTTGRIKLPRRAYSTQEIKKVSSFRDEPIGVSLTSNPEIEEVVSKLETPGKESDDDANKVLCDEISTALNDDIFEREFSFDNKWVDDEAFNSYKDHSDMSTSSHSPLTGSALKKLSNPISRRDSMILQNFKGDLDALTRKKTPNSTSNNNNSSRLQLRLDTLRMKSESTRDTQCFHSDATNAASNALLRYWTTNTDIRTKSVSEGIKRELRSVSRCNSYSGRPGGKMIISMMNQLSIEKQGESQMQDDASSSSESTLSAHPAIKNINCVQNDLLLTNFLDDSLHRKNSDDMFEDEALTSIGDTELRSSIMRGRSHTNRMWLESERLEFDK